MKRNIQCPACQSQITIPQAMKAATPFKIRCGSCKTYLRVQLPGLVPMTVAVALLFGASGIGVFAALVSGHLRVGIFLGVLFLLFWLVVEILGSAFLFTKATFIPVQKASKPST